MPVDDEPSGVAADAETVDSVARWLLRLGIDRRGQLSVTRLWDVAVRAAVLIDLRSSGRIGDDETTTYVDEDVVSGDYEDAACQDLLHGRAGSEGAWVGRGRLRAGDVAADLVTRGEWTSRLAPMSPGLRLYRAPARQHVALHEHLLLVARTPGAARSHQEAAVLMLADALLVLGKDRHGELALRLDECGPFEDLVSRAVVLIGTLDAVSRVNPGGV